MTRGPHIIVTADDFGLHAAANHAIVDVLTSGIVSHTSIITNMPGFEEACELAQSRRFSAHVGVHLNLTQGRPLTEAIRGLQSLCVQGEFAPSNRWNGFRPLGQDAKRAVAGELRAQIAAARARGLRLTHLDSHNDTHIGPNIAGIVAALAREAGIPRVRPARNCGRRQGVVQFVWRRRYNAWLKRLGLMQVQYFGSTEDLLWLAARGKLGPSASAEVMTHPARDSHGVVVDTPFEQPLAERIRRVRSCFDPM